MAWMQGGLKSGLLNSGLGNWRRHRLLLCDVSPWQLGSAQGSTFSVAHLVWLPNPWTLSPLNTIQYNTIQYNAIQYNTIQYKYNTIHTIRTFIQGNLYCNTVVCCCSYDVVHLLFSTTLSLCIMRALFPAEEDYTVVLE